MRRRYVGAIAGALRTLRHGCRGHRFGTRKTGRQMFRLDPKSLVGQSPGPGGLNRPMRGGGRFFQDHSVRPDRSEANTVQALMDLALPRFEGLGDGPR